MDLPRNIPRTKDGHSGMSDNHQSTKSTTGRKRIALNGRFSGTLKPTGTQTVAFYLFDAIIRAPREVDLVVYADSRFPGVAAWKTQPGVEFIEVPFSDWGRAKAQLWEQFIVSTDARKRGCALVHHPLTTCPYFRFGIKHVITLHDVGFYEYPDGFSPSFRAYLRHVCGPGMRRADRLVAVSDYVVETIVRRLRVPASRITRVYNALKPMAGLEQFRNLPRDPNVIFGVNLWQPHKNLARLLAAFAKLRAERPNLELRLAGRPQAMFKDQPELAALLQAPGVNVLGFVSDSDLTKGYATCAVCAYPSLSEGFGLPVIEAMAAGAPVVTSTTTAMPEVAGGNAFLVDPTSVDSIVKGIRDALDESPEARARRVEKGREWAKRFTWQSAAADYLKIYQSLL